MKKLFLCFILIASIFGSAFSFSVDDVKNFAGSIKSKTKNIGQKMKQDIRNKRSKTHEQKVYQDTLAPAVQFDIQDYKDYFKKSSDYNVELSSRSEYVVTCNSDIVGLSWGDIENIKLFDYINQYGNSDMKKFVIKTKTETYSYIRIYKYNGEITNMVVSVNPYFQNKGESTFGLCKIEPKGI